MWVPDPGCTLVPEAYTIDVHLGPADLEAALRRDVLRGLTASPKHLPPKWHYDERGSALFDAITRLPEYYLTRCERSILDAHAGDIAAAAHADTLIELGSGTSEKTRLLLSAMSRAGTLERFVPFDVDEATLRSAAAAIAAEYPSIRVHAVVGDFERHLPMLPAVMRAIAPGTVVPVNSSPDVKPPRLVPCPSSRAVAILRSPGIPATFENSV